MGYARPVVQMHDAVYLVKPRAEIPGIAANAEGIGVRAYFQHLHILLHIAGQAAAVAREHEADAARVRHILHCRFPAHHDYVRVLKLFCDVLRYIQTVAAAGKAEYNVLAHCTPPQKFICIVLIILQQTRRYYNCFVGNVYKN